MSAARALPALVFTLAACAGSTHATGSGQRITAEQARAKLERISPNKVQLWVVVHVRAHKTLAPDGRVDETKLVADTLASSEAVVNGGGDMIILINSRAELPVYERVIAAVREKYPSFPLGISALDYGPRNLLEGFRLAKKFNAQMVWCEVVPDEKIEYEDDDGSYKPAEVVPLELALRTQAEEKPDAIHTAGVHMKYTRPLDGRSFEDAMKAALGSVDGINVTGPQTGVRADVERVKTARRIAGDYPIGLASGVSTENVAEVIGSIDYAIVGTSLKSDEDPLRTSEAKVRALRNRMNELGGGPRP